MRPYGAAAAFVADNDGAQVEAPAAPARVRIRWLAGALLAVLALIGARAVQLAFAHDPDARPAVAAGAAIERGDLADRNGVLLATTVRAYALAAEPARVWNVDETADALIGLFPDLDRAVLVRRLSDKSRARVYLKRGLTPGQRAQAFSLGLAGVSFDVERRRVYPNGALAAHALGFTDPDLKPLGGVEYGLDEAIRNAGVTGAAVRLSLDVRLQYAVETELDAHARAYHAKGGAVVLLDGANGETLALASWPAFDPNDAGAASDAGRLDRAAGAVYELGSAIKPFTLAMALEDRRVQAGERIDVTEPFALDGSRIFDHEPVPNPARLVDILAHSSNIGAAKLALRVGAERQRYYLDRLGLTAPANLQLAHNAAPLAPAPQGRRDVAGLGFGYGLAMTPAALASAYTVFVHDGARMAPTLMLRPEGRAPEATPVFSAATAHDVARLMRAVVTSGTGQAAEVGGLGVAGKTGTAEKLGEDGAYDEARNLSSFAAIFPGAAPRYVLVVVLDEADAGEHATGGATAAPAAGAMLRRIAPILGLEVSAPARDEAR